VRVFTIGHGRRDLEELVAMLRAAGVATLVDVRRFPSSRRNPQFDGAALARSLAESEIRYLHAVELGGRRSGEPGEEAFACIRDPGFRSYVARMRRTEWQRALEQTLQQPTPAFMCAETPWWRCHRKLIAELLVARGHDVVHLLRPGEATIHRLSSEAEVKEGVLYLCGSHVA
jgi:uncharacterized protein (DUF488 family)